MPVLPTDGSVLPTENQPLVSDSEGSRDGRLTPQTAQATESRKIAVSGRGWRPAGANWCDMDSLNRQAGPPMLLATVAGAGSGEICPTMRMIRRVGSAAAEKSVPTRTAYKCRLAPSALGAARGSQHRSSVVGRPLCVQHSTGCRHPGRRCWLFSSGLLVGRNQSAGPMADAAQACTRQAPPAAQRYR